MNTKKFLITFGIVCKVRTQQAENFDEEVKSLVSAWCSNPNEIKAKINGGNENKTERIIYNFPPPDESLIKAAGRG